MRRSIVWIILPGWLLLLAAGCGGNGPELVTVQGKVLDSDGRPVFPGSIWFVADGTETADGAHPLDSSSMLYEDGSFRLRTYPHGDGAMVGKYRVTLSLGAGSSPRLAKYAGPRTTPITIDVPRAGLKDREIRLDSSQTAPVANLRKGASRTGRRGR